MKKIFLESINKVQNILKVRWMRRLTIEGKIIGFKTLAISDIKIPYNNYKWARKNTKNFFLAF